MRVDKNYKVLCNDGTYDIGNGVVAPCINRGGQKQSNPIEGGQGFLDRQNELAKQQALLQEASQIGYSGLTDKVFGKQSNFVSGGGNRFLILPTYVILGTIVGRYVAKNMKKSTTLGMVVGGLAPLLALKLTMEYDKKNMPKQEPKQKVGIEPTLTPKPNKPYMPQIIIEPFGMPVVETDWQKLSKTPNEFVVKSNSFNTRYYKDVKAPTSSFSFLTIPDLYKQPFSTNGISGVQPTKITTVEFLDAYNQFLKQPK